MDPRYLSDTLLERMTDVSAADADPVPVILRFSEARRCEDFVRAASSPQSLIERFNLAISSTLANAAVRAASSTRPPKEHRSIHAVSTALPLGVLKALSDKGNDVGLREKGIEIDHPVRGALNYALPRVGAPPVWQNSLDGAGVRVAVLDSGVDANHPDMRGQVAEQVDFSGEGLGDLNGHGTHVAGIVASKGALQDGRYRGTASGAQVLDVKVLNRYAGGNTSEVIDGIEWAVGAQAQVLNISIEGAVTDGQDALASAANWAVGEGAVVVVAAGNMGPGAATVTTPGAASDVICVAAATPDDAIADYSSRGGAGGARAPDITLPGSIVSTATTMQQLQDLVDDNYRHDEGTSQACPIAAGFAAILLQADATLTPQQIKTLLTATAEDLGANAAAQGAGMANIDRAIAAIQVAAPQPEPQPDPPTQVPEPDQDNCNGQASPKPSPGSAVTLKSVKGEVGFAPNSIGRLRVALKNTSQQNLQHVRARLSVASRSAKVLQGQGDFDQLDQNEADSATFLVEYGRLRKSPRFKLDVEYEVEGVPMHQQIEGTLPITNG